MKNIIVSTDHYTLAGEYQPQHERAEISHNCHDCGHVYAHRVKMTARDWNKQSPAKVRELLAGIQDAVRDSFNAECETCAGLAGRIGSGREDEQ